MVVLLVQWPQRKSVHAWVFGPYVPASPSGVWMSWLAHANMKLFVPLLPCE